LRPAVLPILCVVSLEDHEHRTPVERHVKRSFEDEALDGMGQPLSRRQRQTRRSVEQYLRAGVTPAYMRRLKDIDRELQRHRHRLARAHSTLSEAVHDPRSFAEQWRARAHQWDFGAVNELIRQHNEWYPVERNLPLDPRTRDYVKIRGRSYRRAELGPEWVLEHFPPVPHPVD
jgi:hypothetical protein